MATQLQLRRGNTAQTAVFTGAIAEVTVDTDQKTITVHDGVTLGGNYIVTKSQLDANLAIIQGVNNTQNTNITSVNQFAQSAFNTANGANGLAAGAFNTANGANGLAQGAFNTANGVNGLAQGAYNTANGANGLAAGAYNQANTNSTNITAVNNFAQSAFNTANSKFSSSGGSISGDVSVTGNLTVTGTTFYANTEQLQVKDNIITLNSNVTGSPTLDAGIEINRGTETNTVLKWSESNHVWQFTNDGTNYFRIADTDRVNSVYSLANTNATNIAIIQGVDLTQNNTITAVNQYAASAFNMANGANGLAAGAYNQANTNATNISIINGIDATQNTRLNSIETINSDQNTAITIIQGVNSWQNTQITEVNQYAQSAYGQANTNATNININSGVNETQNTRLNSIESVNLDQNTAISIIQGVNLGQNTTITEVNQYAASAYNAANGANGLAVGAYDTANGANGLAAGAFNKANTNADAIAIIQGVDLGQNNTITAVNNFAQSAYATANGANGLAQSAFDKANTGGIFTGSVTINQDLTVSGNVNITGNVISHGADDLIINDPLIYVANNNTGNLVDIGLVGNFNDGVYQHTGIVRDATDGVWKLFSNVVAEPTTTVDFTYATWDNLKVGTLTGNVTANSITVNGISVTGAQDKLVNDTREVTLFANGVIRLPEHSALYNNTANIIANTADQVLDSFSSTVYRTAKYLIQGINGGDVHSTEIILTHDDTDVYISEYGTIGSNTSLYTVSSSLAAGLVNLTVSPANSNTTFDFIRTSLIARTLGGVGLQGDLMTQSGSEDLNTGSGSEDLNV